MTDAPGKKDAEDGKLEDLPLTELIGKRLERVGSGECILTVGTVSIGPSRSVYIHPSSPESFGWTFKDSAGRMCGDWREVKP